MGFLFKSKHKTPADLVRSTKELITKFDPKKLEEISKCLAAMKQILYGDSENEAVPDLVNQLSQEVHTSDFLIPLIQQLSKLEFEAKKDATLVFSHLLRGQVGSRHPTVDYLSNKEQVLVDLVKGYENPDLALTTGLMLRECFKYQALAKIILLNPVMYNFFDYAELNAFDIASDSFSSFKDLMTKHKSIVAEYLEHNYDKFFGRYTTLLNSTNYVTKRQSLKLLGEILLDRANFNVMTMYISSPDNLMLMMNLLRDKAKNIQFEAFHVFKVFVANPNKTKPILEILTKNKEKLISFLGSFLNDREEDEQFAEEKAFLLKQISDL